LSRASKKAESINVGCLSYPFLDCDLPRERSEITVSDLPNGLGGESFPFEPGRDVGGLFAKARSKALPIVRVLQERLFATDAFDFVVNRQRAIIFAEGELF
jgi:hypothetical protein